MDYYDEVKMPWMTVSIEAGPWTSVETGLRSIVIRIRPGIRRNRGRHTAPFNMNVSQGSLGAYRNYLTYASDEAWRLVGQHFAPGRVIGFSLEAFTGDGQRILYHQPFQRTLTDLSPRWMWDAILAKLQSGEEFEPDFRLTVSQYMLGPHRPFQLAGGRVEWTGPLKAFIENKKSVIAIQSETTRNCFLQWIVLGLAFVSGDKKEYKKLIDGGRIQENRQQAVQLLLQQYPFLFNFDQSHASLQQLEQLLRVRFCWLDLTQQLEQQIAYPPMTSLPYIDVEPVLYGIVTRAENTAPNSEYTHIHFLKNPKSLINNKQWCELCFSYYRRIKHTGDGPCTGLCTVCHVCVGRCRSCLQTNCIGLEVPDEDDDIKYEPGYPKKCNHCPHVITYSSICSQLHRCVRAIRNLCGLCGKQDHPNRGCYEVWCECGELVNRRNLDEMDQHICYLTRKDLRAPSDQWAVYDYECYLNTANIHVPYLVSIWFPYASSATQATLSHYLDHTRHRVGIAGTLLVFHRDKLHKFYDLLSEPCFKHWAFFAHNGKGYDHIFIKEAFMKRGLGTKDIARGEKFIQLTIPELKIVFRDSLSFIQRPLRKFPKEFNIKELKKGHFPHPLMTEAYYNLAMQTLGQMPKCTAEDFNQDHDYRDGDGEKDKKEADTWIHNWLSNGEPTWNVFTDAEEYNISDTLLLGQGMQIFKEEVRHLATKDFDYLDPFVYPTLPSAIMNFYLAKWLPEKTITVIDRARCLQSRIAETWLLWVEHSTGLSLEREVQIGSYRVDGFDRTSNTVFEFLGCYFHGCPTCTKGTQYNKRFKCLNSDLYRQVEYKTAWLRAKGFSVQVKWECDWKQTLLEDDTKHWYENYTDIEDVLPIDPRRAYRGGMTEVYCFYYKGKIQMVDFASEYPSICLGQTYDYIKELNECRRILAWQLPTGPVTIRRGNLTGLDITASNKCGIAKCRILPPRHLYVPFLGYTAASKTVPSSYICMYGLCKCCMDQRLERYCTHTNRQRAFCDTWTIRELQYAVSLGYEIEHVYELWEYENSSTTLFREFLIPFVIQKMTSTRKEVIDETTGEFTAAGWEVVEYFQLLRPGSIWTPADFVENPGRKFVAKLMMNSFYGKWGQREEHIEQREFLGPAQLKKAAYMLMSDEYIVLNGEVLNEAGTSVALRYEPTRGSTLGHKEKNDHIAAYIPSQGREMLHRASNALGRRALYCDTDSVYHIKLPDGEPEVYYTGNRLGDLQLELELGDTFAAICRKSYGYFKCENPQAIIPMQDPWKLVLKQKGIVLKLDKLQLFEPKELYRLMLETHAELLAHPDASHPEQMEFMSRHTIVVPQTQFATERGEERRPRKKTASHLKHVSFNILDPRRWIQWTFPQEPLFSLPFGYCQDIE